MLLVIGSGGDGLADTVQLKNGGSFEGLILQEDAEHIELQMGPGTMRIQRRRVSSIQRSSPLEQGRLRNEWRRQYYLHDVFVPPGHQDTAARFQKLKTNRDTARRSAAVARTTQRKQVAIRQKADGIVAQLQVLTHRLQAQDPQRDTKAYNAIVLQMNAHRADLQLKMDALQRLNADRDKALGRAAEYMGALSDFETWCQPRAAAAAGSKDAAVRDFYVQLLAELQTLTGEFDDSLIPTRQEGRSTLVTATLNGSVAGTFVLDTGAAIVSLSEGLATRLGVDVASLPMAPVRVADGRRVEGHALMLKSVKVGDAYVEDVPAIVLPDPPAPGCDGLLGMSFLRNFVIRIDGATGDLVLRRMNPGR